MRAFCKWEQLAIKPPSSGSEDDIISNGPHDAFGREAWSLVASLSRRANWLARLDSDAAVETGKPHPIAECVCEYARIHIARAQKHEGGEEAKQGRVCELEDGACYGQHPGRLRVSYAKLVQVVDVGNAKVERGQEDDLLARKVGEDVQRNDERAPYQLFADGTLVI